MRIAVKKILRKHGYPPDLEKRATDTILQQAQLLAGEFTEVKQYRTLNPDDLLLAAEPSPEDD
jgi:type I restriction enzyme, R subunit